ncbi:ATP-dependent Clp protease proteolytic subunit [Amycolatopsis bartoniae]|uniref:ATP-dependent Clp protease proteolytic subunit n=1 Tax=Amycolatopsis bartoniae TaxID=941986 RepID=A0A8H9MBS0_9PSEU|nr:ATP-dependent Clp protease proteolytic subunit [Amycolatopsis bartoniae]TVT02957.1 ATP-dependent Clp protease proteolytic subunit [Amycolatopsis bartoniae]GHF47724.1 ATP-dependent Clp protease proteolytic subunit [Amycolatopsis bartoniae]
MTAHLLPQLRSPGSDLTFTDSVYEQLLRDRIVFLGSEVTDEVANRITAQLLLLAADDPEKDITFYINSPGGSVTAGMAVYDTMCLIKPDVSTFGLGFVASMGQFLLTSGTPGKRFLLPNTRIVMHQPSAGIHGPATDIAIQAEVFGKMKRRIAEITARQTGQPVERITADADRDRWFDAEEALAYGFVDQIVGGGDVALSA